MSFSTHLTYTFNFSTVLASLFFNVDCISYFIMVQFTQKLSRKFGSLRLVFSGFLINCFFLLLLGPSQFLPKSWIIVIVGLLFSGISGALIYGPIIALFVDILNKKSNDDKNCDIAGFLFNFVVIVGQFIGPIIGGFIIERNGFLFSCNVISVMNLVFLAVFYFMYKENLLAAYKHSTNEDDMKVKAMLFCDFSYDVYNDELAAFKSRKNSHY